MSKLLFSDNTTTTLATGINSGATSCTVAAGAGSLFPQPNTTTGTYFFATFVSASNPNTKEVVTCTARSTDTMTISPTTQAWDAGDTFALFQPAEAMEALVQFDDLQAQAGNYAIDTGSANAYVVTLTPALSTPSPGTPIRWLAAHANTGASTFNGQAFVLNTGAALLEGDIVANGLYTSTWNTALNAYQLDGVIVTEFSQLSGEVADDQVPESAVTQFAAALFAGPTLTGTPTTPTAAPNTNTTQIASCAFALSAALAAAAAVAPIVSGNAGAWTISFSGALIQGGSFQSNGGQVVVSFPQNFQTACWGVWCMSTAGGGYTATLVGAPSTADFVSGTGEIPNNTTVYWIAVGN